MKAAPGTRQAALKRYRASCEPLIHHGVVPLLDAEFRDRAELAGWPKEIQVECFTGALVHAAYESAQRAEAARVIDALVADGVPPLVLKGSALACTLYADPSLRTRCDTDLLIPLPARAQADRVLESLGYSRAEGVAGEFISYQSSWSRTDASGNVHYLDMHWRINNSQVLARCSTTRTSRPAPCLFPAWVPRRGHWTPSMRCSSPACIAPGMPSKPSTTRTGPGTVAIA